MNPGTNQQLLAPADPNPVAVINPDGGSRFLLIGDHAGDAVPERLGDMGISAADRARHIAIDIGVRALGERLAERLDAMFIHQRYSRLVVDCNRDPARDDAMPAISDGTVVPANAGLSAFDRAARVAAIHAPYQRAIADTLDQRARGSRGTVLVSLHSFTPRMGGIARPWHAGILHDGHDDGFALALLAALLAMDDIVTGDNEPYQMDGIDHTIPRHAFARRLPYAEIEVRQDEIADAAGVDIWAARLAGALETAWDSFAAPAVGS